MVLNKIEFIWLFIDYVHTAYIKYLYLSSINVVGFIIHNIITYISSIKGLILFIYVY